MKTFHTPVLLQEVIDYLEVATGKKYIDSTVGGGGHGFEILKRGGKVLGIEVDQDAIDYVNDKIKNQKSKIKNAEDLILARGNFREIDKIARLHGFEKVSGILFDLGVSSFQLEKAERGFSFQKEGPLDMRMDPSADSASSLQASSGQVTAADLVNALTKGELYELFTKLGEERYARAISESIARARRVRPITTTIELSDIVQKVYGRHSHFTKINPATKAFQALRIAVNDELNSLQEALPKAIELLESKGKLAVISFHSLEDRIVKNSFNEFEREKLGTVLTKKPVMARESEVQSNIRARSAKLRVFSARG